ncbi:MAG: hypothetical protein IJT55_05250 [Prevotella sp.]|nr:hypothetical protein [Prevotella sp.]
MKKVMMMMFLSVVLTGTVYAQKTTTFLDEMKKFVEQVEAKDSIKANEVPALDAKYNDFRTRYKNEYRDKMTNQELSQYSEYRTRYQKKLFRNKSQKVIDEIDSVGNSMSKGIERGASKVGGFIKGLFKKK